MLNVVMLRVVMLYVVMLSGHYAEYKGAAMTPPMTPLFKMIIRLSYEYQPSL
jgi:hypothetical protein